MEMDIGQIVKELGFPIVAAGGMGYFIYFIWKWVTDEIDPVLGQASGTLIGLIDRIRMLDNDLIRLNQKLNTVLTLREQQQMHEEEIKMLRRIIEENGIEISHHEKTYSINDLQKIYKEEKHKPND